jgi:hypothetical protein
MPSSISFSIHCYLTPVEMDAVFFELLETSLSTTKFKDKTVAVLAFMASIKK